MKKVVMEEKAEPRSRKSDAGIPLSLRIFMPFTVDEEISGGIGLGRKISGESYTSGDSELLETIASQGAVAIGNARLLEQLGRRVFHLKTLYDTTREIDFLLDPWEILHHLLLMTLKSFGAGSGVALLVEKGQGKLEAIAHRGLDETKIARFRESLEKGPSSGFDDLSSTTVLEAEGKEAGGSKDRREKSLLTDLLSSLEMKVWVPFSVNESFIGGIGLGEKIVGDPYTKDDQELLDTLASLGAAAIKNAKLLEQMKKD